MAATVLTGAQLWDGRGEETITRGAVRVEHGRITAVGSVGEIEILPEDKVLEWPSATLMPGLIDCHNHLSMDPRLKNYLARMNDSVDEQRSRAIPLMRRDLAAGVTTSRCCGDREFLDVECRDKVACGDLEGPRLLVATRGIRASNGHGFVGYPFDGADAIQRAIRTNLEAGADFIKLYITGTLRGNGALPSYLSRDEISAAIEEAHDAGVRVAAHCVGGEGLDWSVDAGLDTLEHVYHISDRQIERVVKSGTRIVLTPSPYMNEARVNNLPPDLVHGHISEHDIAAERMMTVIASGLPFALGTDGQHGGMAGEIAFAVELGASHVQALMAATVHGAEVCGVDENTGTLAPGKWADIIAVTGDPLEDVKALNKVAAVMKQGVVHETG